MSPFLFSVYTADCRPSHPNCVIDKYADDTVLTGLISNDEDSHYRQEIGDFVRWCESNYLVLNAGKTKEMIIDFRRKEYHPKPVEIRGDAIKRVETYKYLGVTIDSRLSWKQSADEKLKKVNTRLFCLHKLNSFAVDQQILQLFHSSALSSVLAFGVSSWGGNICRRDNGTLNKIIKKSSSVVGRTQDGLDILYDRGVTKKLKDILTDATHFLRLEFDRLMIERHGGWGYQRPKPQDT